MSSKIRNRNAHITNGNCAMPSPTPSKTRSGAAAKLHVSHIQRCNLIPGAMHRKRKANISDKENDEPPVRLPSGRQWSSKRRRKRHLKKTKADVRRRKTKDNIAQFLQQHSRRRPSHHYFKSLDWFHIPTCSSCSLTQTALTPQ